MPQLPATDTSVGGNTTAGVTRPKKKRPPVTAPAAPSLVPTADHADQVANQEAAALRVAHRQDVMDRQAGRAERQITRQTGEYLRENTLYNAPERQAVLDSINARVSFVDPRLLSGNPRLAAELVMGTTKTRDLRGASTAAYQGWQAQQEDLFNAQQAGQRHAYAQAQMELQRADPQGYAISQGILANPDLLELTEQISSIKWLSSEKRAYLMSGVAQALDMDGTAYDYQVGGLWEQLRQARRGTLEIPAEAPTEGFGEFLHMGQEAFNIVPFSISKGTDIFGAGLERLPGGKAVNRHVIDVAQEGVGDVLGAVGTGATTAVRNLEGAAVLVGEAPSALYHGVTGGEPQGGFLTADELWTTWGEAEKGEHGPFAVVLARSLDTDVSDPRYQNWFTFTDMTADLIGQVGLFKALSGIKTAIRTTEAGGGRFSGSTMLGSKLLGGPRLMRAIWDTIKDVPEGQRAVRLVDKFKKGMTPTLANDIRAATTLDEATRVVARHLDDVPDIEVPKAEARLSVVTEDMRHTGLGPEMDALKAEKASLEQRIWDLTNRETIYEFPRISHIRPFMRGLEGVGPVGRMVRTFFGFTRETGAVDVSRITNDLTTDAAKLFDPAALTKPEGWASHNFEVLRKTMDVVKVDKTVQRFVLEAMFEVEKGNLSFFDWRRMVEDAYRSGKRYTPDMEEGIRLSTRTVDERMHAPVEVEAEGGSFLRNAATDEHGNPLPVRPSQLLEDSATLPSMQYLELAAKATSRLDAWAKTQPAVIGKTVGALRATTGWTSFVMFQGPRLIMRPLLLALNPKMFTKIEVDQSLRGFFKAGVTPLDWWSVKGRRLGAATDLVEGGVPVEPPTLANRLPTVKDPLTGAEIPDYTAMGLVANEFLPEVTSVRTRVNTNFDPAIKTTEANLVAEGVADHILELASDSLTQRIAVHGAEETIRFLQEHPNHPLSVEMRTRVMPRIEAAQAGKLGTDPIPSGTTRLLSVRRHGSIEAVRSEGLVESGTTTMGERPGVFGQDRMDGEAARIVRESDMAPGEFVVEYYAMPDQIIPAQRTGTSTVQTRSIPPEQIVRIYTPDGALGDIVRQQELEIKQVSGGNPEIERSIGTQRWRRDAADPDSGLGFVEDELRTARETLAVTESALERETLNLRIEQLERKYDALNRQRSGSLDIRDKDALAQRIKDDWVAGDYHPTHEVFVKRRLARNAPGGKLEAARGWAQQYNQRIYKAFRPMNAVTRDMSRGSLYRKVLDQTERRLLDLGYSPEHALAAAQYRAAFIAKDLMYDISARSSIDRKLQELFWFEPVWREQLSVWLTKIPSQAFWAPGIALEVGLAHTLLQGLKDMGLMYDSEPFVNPDTGKEVPGRPYFRTPWGNVSVGGFNPLSPGSETLLPTISPGAEAIFDWTAQHVPEEYRHFFEAFADKFTYDRNVESTPWMPRSVALAASNIIGVAEFFGLHLGVENMSLGAISEARQNSLVRGRQWAMTDLADEGILPPTQGADESDSDFYGRLKAYNDKIDTRARRFSVGLDFLYTLNGAFFPGTVENAGVAPEGVAWREWRYETGPLADVAPGDMAPWQYDIQNAYLSAHPEQWPWSVSTNEDTDPDPDVYDPAASLDPNQFTLNAIEKYHYWGDPPDDPESAAKADLVKRDPAAFAALEPRKQAKLLAQWSTDDISDLTPLMADALGLPSFEGREDLMAVFGAIQRQYEAKYDYDKSDEVKKFLANERDFLLEKAARQYGANGTALLDYMQAPPIKRLTEAGLLTTPEVGIVQAKAIKVRRDAITEGGAWNTITGYGMLENKIDLYRLVDQLRKSNPAFDREIRYIELGLGEKDGPQGRVAAYETIFFNEPLNYFGYQDDIVKGLH